MDTSTTSSQPQVKTQFVLSQEVVSPTDVFRLLREVQQLDDFFRQAAIRSGGTPQTPPRYSRLLDTLSVQNSLNLLDSSHREFLLAQLSYISEHSPVLHMSFSVDPPGAYVQKIVAWIRQNLQADVLLRVGLQPNIGAGCVLRSTNRSFDFSLRKYFESKRGYFGKKLHEAVVAQDGVGTEATDPNILSTTPLDNVDVPRAKPPQLTATDIQHKEAAAPQQHPQPAATPEGSPAS